MKTLIHPRQTWFLGTLILFFLAGTSFTLGAQNLGITQIDSSRLFLSSRLDVFLSLTDPSGLSKDLSDPQGELSFYQKFGEESLPLPILDIRKNSESEEAITFLLVLDNSGSMYETQGGREHRNRQAVKAINRFVSQLDPQKDRLGLAWFNRDYELTIPPKGRGDDVKEGLNQILAPPRDEAYTEIYYAIVRAAEDMAGINGRKAIIFLSDGENFPYFERTGTPHPSIGEKNYLPGEAALALAESETTLYAINFAREKDLPLADIAKASGGRVFDAYNEEELGRVYSSIRRSIQEEYRVSLKVPVSLESRPEIQVVYRNQPGASRSYATGLIFSGSPADSFFPGLLLLIAGALLWLLLFLLRLERPAVRGELKFLPAGSGNTLIKTQILNTDKTIIGSSASANVTITGIPTLEESHAVIEKDEKTGNYTVLSKTEILVNNQPVKKRILKPGDVLNMEGATLIFDAPEGAQKDGRR